MKRKDQGQQFLPVPGLDPQIPGLNPYREQPPGTYRAADPRSLVRPDPSRGLARPASVPVVRSVPEEAPKARPSPRMDTRPARIVQAEAMKRRVGEAKPTIIVGRDPSKPIV